MYDEYLKKLDEAGKIIHFQNLQYFSFLKANKKQLPRLR